MRNKILIIDDDTGFVGSLKQILEINGYDVIEAYTGEDGFQRVKDDAPDVVLLDMVMSYATEGAEVAQALAKDASTKDIPVVLMIGDQEARQLPFELKADAEKLPVKRILEKPIKAEVLINLIQTFVAQSGKEHRQVIEGLDALAEKWKGKRGSLIMILHAIQNHYGYVPRGVSLQLSRILDVPLARIYEVITFYNYFKIDPPGKHVISVCLGTACYLKGTTQILSELKNILHVEEAETTKDGLFHLQVVRCLGCCGLAPVMMIDDKVYGKVKKEDLRTILANYTKADSQAAGAV